VIKLSLSQVITTLSVFCMLEVSGLVTQDCTGKIYRFWWLCKGDLDHNRDDVRERL